MPGPIHSGGPLPVLSLPGHENTFAQHQRHDRSASWRSCGGPRRPSSRSLCRPRRSILRVGGLVMKYKVVLKHSEEGVSASVPGLPGCWSQGATEEEALENIQDAIREYLP